MSDEIIPSEQLTRERLQAIFDAAFVQYSLDADGDIVVKDGNRIFVMPSAEKETLTFMSYFRTNPEAAETDLYAYVNGVNDNLIGIRAYITAKPSVCFDFTILTNGGVTARQIVLSLRRFANFVAAALRRDTSDVIPSSA